MRRGFVGNALPEAGANSGEPGWSSGS